MNNNVLKCSHSFLFSWHPHMKFAFFLPVRLKYAICGRRTFIRTNWFEPKCTKWGLNQYFNLKEFLLTIFNAFIITGWISLVIPGYWRRNCAFSIDSFYGLPFGSNPINLAHLLVFRLMKSMKHRNHLNFRMSKRILYSIAFQYSFYSKCKVLYWILLHGPHVSSVSLEFIQF